MVVLRAVFFGGCIVACLAVSSFSQPQSPATRPVSAKLPAAQIVLDRLRAAPPGQFYLGQNIGHANDHPRNNYADSITPLVRSTGRQPAILGLDYGYDQIPRDLAAANQILIDYHRQGGIVTVSMHPPNPWTRTGSHDTQQGAAGTYNDLVQPGTVAYRRWHATLDQVAGGLAELEAAGVPVLWRPLHEMNGGWFWWCPGNRDGWPTPAEFRTVWQDMFTYLVREKGLTNLLWVYSAAVQISASEKPSDYYYPGGDLVDIVGLDWYVDDPAELDRRDSYARLAALRKPLGLTEFGPRKQRDGGFDALSIVNMVRQAPRLSFVVFWHSWPENQVAIADLKNGSQLLADPSAMTLAKTTGPQ